ncbi:MAG: GGDEF domain-containing protein, partial [Pseudomonadota bacterium]
MSELTPRRLSHVLARVTLLLALALGSLAGITQIAVDLQQEKDAVEYSAEEFLSSVAPSASSAAYNFYMPAAEQVAEGLFTQRAIQAVTITNEGQVMISREREVNPTLPNLGHLTQRDLITLEQPLLSPEGNGDQQQIGAIYITVDRSIVAPAFVNRMLYYFVFATAKNFLLGILLIWIVYAALARHIVGLADTVARWRPTEKAIEITAAPRLLRGTELDDLSQQIVQLAQTASGSIQQAEASRAIAEQSNTELTHKSEQLSQAVQDQNCELQKANNRLKELAEMDALTGLYNRRSFDHKASLAFQEHADTRNELAIAMIDVDFFKAYNDHYGHQAGDRCLAQIAQVVQTSLESPNVTVARYGGEEFIVLFEHHDDTKAQSLIDRLRAQICDANIEHQRSTVAERVTISVGYASSANDQISTLDDLISSADEALYEAKATGRNCIVVSSKELRDRVREARNEALQLLKAVHSRTFET